MSGDRDHGSVLIRPADGRAALFRLMIGAAMISFSGVWVKVSHVTPTVSAFYRVFFGGLFLFVAAFYHGEIRWRGRRNLLLGLACGFLFTLDLILYHYSIHWVGPGLGTILPNFQVFILALIGVLFFKEQLRSATLLSMPLASFGLYLIVGFEGRTLGSDYQLGIYCGLAAAFCYAAFLLTLRKLQAEQQGLSIFYVLMLVSMAASAFIALEVQRAGEAFAIPDLQTLGALVTLGLLSQCVGWILIAMALPHIRASLSGLILLMQPALAFVWDVLFFQRPTGVLNWMGVFIALAAIYLGAVPHPTKAKQPKAVPSPDTKQRNSES
jgi:drug/metabolite transporter (DMT)-like permease